MVMADDTRVGERHRDREGQDGLLGLVPSRMPSDLTVSGPGSRPK